MDNGLNEERQQMLLSTLSYYAEVDSIRRSEYDNELHLLNMMRTLNIEPYIDGDSWCALFGSDIQTGMCGFGKSVISALSNLRDNLNKNINNEK